MTSFTAQLVGGPTALLEYGGLRWLTDPALSPPGEYAGGLVKVTGPAVAPEALEPIDVVLLSHDQHSDNLDPGGRDLLPRAGRVLTTRQAAERLGGTVTGLEPWSAVEVLRPDGGAVVVTAVPAQHGPDGCEPVMGPVTGFLLRGEGLETVYVSGDNASLDVVRGIARPTASTGPTSRCRASAPPRRRRSSAPAPSCRCTSRAGPTSPRARTPCARRSSATSSPTGSCCSSAARRWGKRLMTARRATLSVALPQQGALPCRRCRGRPPRSEERRVGKECRSRWSPYH